MRAIRCINENIVNSGSHKMGKKNFTKKARTPPLIRHARYYIEAWNKINFIKKFNNKINKITAARLNRAHLTVSNVHREQPQMMVAS